MKRREAGVTLIELMIAITLVAALSGSSQPRLRLISIAPPRR